ncbi:MAG: DUF456 domain-containing protein [Pseudomonadota bacterium]
MDTTVIILLILAALLVIAGFIGLIIPAMPGALLLFGGLVLAAWAEDFRYVGFWTLAVLLVLTILTYIADVVSTAFGAKQFGASTRAAIGAVIGGVVGLFLGLIGILIGPFVGAVLAELTIRHDMAGVTKAGIGAWVGMILGTAAKMALAISMIGIYLLKRFL